MKVNSIFIDLFLRSIYIELDKQNMFKKDSLI